MGNEKIDDLWNKYENSALIIIIYLFILSMRGLPPLIGFIPKLIIIYLLVKYSVFSIIILIVGSLINLFFLFKYWSKCSVNKSIYHPN